MKTVPDDKFVQLRRSALAQLPPIAGRNADGFMLDVQYALEGKAGLARVRVKKTGDLDCRFRATAGFGGNLEEATWRILSALEEDIGYAEAEDVASISTAPDLVQISYLTWATEIGVVTLWIEATRET